MGEWTSNEEGILRVVYGNEASRVGCLSIVVSSFIVMSGEVIGKGRGIIKRPYVYVKLLILYAQGVAAVQGRMEEQGGGHRNSVIQPWN